jgi:predicted nucleic acid-binding protein
LNYLLDTCVISELVRPTPDENVVNWLNQTPDERLFLSVIAIGEIRKGITRLPDSNKKNRLTNWLNTLLDNYESRILPINLTVAETWGNIQAHAETQGTPLASIDSLIAAVALTHNLIIVTRNESDFAASNAPLLNPWKNLG